jgi:hypothetical protein
MGKTFKKKILSESIVNNNTVKYIQTEIHHYNNGNILCGYVEINGEAAYNFERKEDKGKILERYCGYGEDYTWSDWQ